MKFILALTVAAVFSLTNGQIDDYNSEVLDFVNKIRTASGKKNLCFNTKVAAAAQVVAKDLAYYQIPQEFTTEVHSVKSVLTANKVQVKGSKEAYGVGIDSSEAMVNQWNITHRDVLLSDFSFFGAGFVENKILEFNQYWVIGVVDIMDGACE
ncbi:hypothetical protein CCR75_004058 [Bremia lactucae]|uniref:SCP domain-containing protein n=1 Tax=Bremia lactucae TaxID=4779 RepID=A0A976IBL5_BRELC|nr:hypothetical protein CCR75_004058 [Bremia lactucae]